MKLRFNLSAARLTTVLGLLLGLAYLLVLSGRIAEDDAPTVANTSGGGLSALAALLRESGYRVRVEEDLKPRFRREEFVIAALPNLPFYVEDGEEKEKDTSVAKTLPVVPGGALLMNFSPQVRGSGVGSYYNRVTRQFLKLQVGEGDTAPARGLAPLGPLVPLVSAEGAKPVLLAGSQKGARVLVLDRAEMAANRHVDREQNAAFLAGLIREAAPGKEIVFYEGLALPGGLLAALGDWAFAARNQALLALGLLVASLGSRFGLAPKARRRELGQREQSDALGNLLRRWRGPRIGIDAAIEQSRRRLASARKLPSSAPREQWDKYLSPELIAAIEEAEEWTRQGAKEGEALRAVAKLDAATDAEVAGVYRRA